MPRDHSHRSAAVRANANRAEWGSCCASACMRSSLHPGGGSHVVASRLARHAPSEHHKRLDTPMPGSLSTANDRMKRGSVHRITRERTSTRNAVPSSACCKRTACDLGARRSGMCWGMWVACASRQKEWFIFVLSTLLLRIVAGYIYRTK
jgi:hypothetical protein